MTPAPARVDPGSMLQITGGISAIAIALAVWVDDRNVGPTVREGPFLTLVFLSAGLIALVAALAALTLLLLEIDPVVTRGTSSGRELTAAILLIFLVFAFLVLGVAYYALLVILLS